MHKAETICAAVCTYNRYDLLPLAIDSLMRQTMSPDKFTILVVDNSPDAKIAKEHSKQYSGIKNLKYIHEKVAGLSNARNVSCRTSSADIIAFLDDDAIASPEWAEHILEGFNKFERVGVLGGRISPIWEAPRPNWLGDDLLSYVSVIDWGGDLRVAAPHEWFAGANISFQRKLVLECGGFDVSLGRTGSGASLLSNEETKLTDHIKELGYQMVYAPLAHVDHLVEQRRLDPVWFRRRMAWQAISDYMAGNDKSLERLDQAWDWTLTYLSAQRPDERSFRGLYAPRNDGAAFKDQLSALYNYVQVMLAGFPVAR